MFRKIEIIPFRDEYIREVLEILEENFSNPWSDKLLKNKIPFLMQKILLIDGKIAGFAEFKVIEDEADLQIIAIKKEYQRKGYGKLFLSKLLKELKERGIEYIYLEVSEKNTNALHLYKKLGFKEMEKREKYYKNGDNAVLMKLKLHGDIYENKR
jgi:ribosomal-protein-alanine N-acetyltransferase